MRTLFGFLAGIACAAVTFGMVLGFTDVEPPTLAVAIAAAIGLMAGVVASRSWRGR